LKLRRPSFPNIQGTAGYFFIQAGHRVTAVEHAIEVIGRHAAEARTSFADDPIMAALEQPMEAWVVVSMFQGAWLREYHEWEKATKSYFEGQHERNKAPKPDWRAKIPNLTGQSSHVDRIRAQLLLFGASLSKPILDTIDVQRRLVNAAKHEEEYFASEQDYQALVEAIADFWNELAQQEQFTV